MTTPAVVRTFTRVSFSPDSDREFVWYFTVKELSDVMKQDIMNSYGHVLERDTKHILLTLWQMQYMCIRYQNAAPFTKAIIKDRLLGISYGVPKVSYSECSICTRGGAVSINLYTSKTMINYAVNVNKGYREVLGGDYMYLHFKHTVPADFPISFVTKLQTLVIEESAVPTGTYYPYVLLSSVPPMVRQLRGANKNPDICQIDTAPFADFTGTTATPRNYIKPYLLIGRIGTRQTLCKTPIDMSKSYYNIISSDRQRYTFTMFYNQGNSRVGGIVSRPMQINSNINNAIIGAPMKENAMEIDQGAGAVVSSAKMDVGRKHPAEGEAKKDKEHDKRMKTSVS